MPNPAATSEPQAIPQPSELDTVEHPSLGTLKFPKDMPYDQRNQIISEMEAKKPPSATERFMNSAGIPKSFSELGDAAVNMLSPQASPTSPGFGQTLPVVGPLFRAQRETYDQPGVAGKVYGSIPLVGPPGYQMGKSLESGDYAGAAGSAVNIVTQLLGLKGGSKLAAPTKAAEATGQKFIKSPEIEGEAQPVSVRRTPGQVAPEHVLQQPEPLLNTPQPSNATAVLANNQGMMRGQRLALPAGPTETPAVSVSALDRPVAALKAQTPTAALPEILKKGGIVDALKEAGVASPAASLKPMTNVPSATLQPVPYMSFYGATNGESAALMQLTHTTINELRGMALQRGIKFSPSDTHLQLISKIHSDLSPQELEAFDYAAQSRNMFKSNGGAPDVPPPGSAAAQPGSILDQLQKSIEALKKKGK